MAKNRKSKAAPEPEAQTPVEETAQDAPVADEAAPEPEAQGEEQSAGDKATEDAEPPAKEGRGDLFRNTTFVKEPSRLGPCPNLPSFDYDPETSKPNLREGETVLSEGEADGVAFVSTNCGRRIFICTIPEFEERFGALQPRELWQHYFPHAVGTEA